MHYHDCTEQVTLLEGRGEVEADGSAKQGSNETAEHLSAADLMVARQR